MTTQNWPDPKRAFFPINPEVNGWHWICDKGEERPVWWCASSRAWYENAGAWAVFVNFSPNAEYRGIAPNRAQISEMLAAERERAATAIDHLKNEERGLYATGLMTTRAEITIRALASAADEIRNLGAAP